jgi:plasmid maintenance system antidote protein VapI
MARKRRKVHSRYYKIPAYQILAGKVTDLQIARIMGISRRTYHDKIEGWTDFSAQQILSLSELLGVAQDELLKQEE